MLKSNDFSQPSGFCSRFSPWLHIIVLTVFPSSLRHISLSLQLKSNITFTRSLKFKKATDDYLESHVLQEETRSVVLISFIATASADPQSNLWWRTKMFICNTHPSHNTHWKRTGSIRWFKKLRLGYGFKQGSYGACGMSCLLRCHPQAIVQGSKAGFWDTHQALGIADWGLSTSQRQQDGLEGSTRVILKKCTSKIVQRTQIFYIYIELFW